MRPTLGIFPQLVLPLTKLFIFVPALITDRMVSCLLKHFIKKIKSNATSTFSSFLIVMFETSKRRTALLLILLITEATFSSNMLPRCGKLRLFVAVLLPLRATNFHVARRRNDVFFLQHKNVARGGGNTYICNAATFVGRQVERKCCSYYLAFALNPQK